MTEHMNLPCEPILRACKSCRRMLLIRPPGEEISCPECGAKHAVSYSLNLGTKLEKI